MAAESRSFTGKTISTVYTIQERLGKGGMGEAYKAGFFHQNNPIVVKFLLHVDDASIKKFQKEAGVHSSLTHPNIVPFYRYGIHEEGTEKIPYIVMALAQEGSVHELIRQRRVLTVDKSSDILLQSLEGLQYAHEQKVLHRDLKPHNLLLQKEPKSQQHVVWVSDFGIAITAHRLDTSDINLTKQDVSGTYAYMSPEQFTGNARIPSDIYSLGIIGYQLLTGQLPFVLDPRNFDNALMYMHAYFQAHEKTPVPSFVQSRRRQGLDMTYPVGEYEEIIATALQKDPAERFKSAGDFAEAIKATQARIRAKEEADKKYFDMRQVKAEINRDYAQKLLIVSNKFLASHQAEVALALYSLANELDPNNEEAYFNKGNLLHSLGRYEEAMAAYNQALILNPTYSDVYFNKGVVLFELGGQEEAILAIEQAFKLDPKNNYSLIDNYYYRFGGWETTIEALDKLIEFFPSNSAAYTKKGELLELVHRREDALVMYDKAIEFDPTNSLAFVKKVSLLFFLVRRDEANLVYKEAIKNEPAVQSLFGDDLLWIEEELGSSEIQQEFNSYGYAFKQSKTKTTEDLLLLKERYLKRKVRYEDPREMFRIFRTNW